MAIKVTYPGVYIDEFEPSAPIQGVGTSTAAFVGLNSIGSPMTPTFLTSWDGYLQTFAPPAPTPPDDGDYLYYAVRGFFLNGGKTCYVTAVSNATADSLVRPTTPPRLQTPSPSLPARPVSPIRPSTRRR